MKTLMASTALLGLLLTGMNSLAFEEMTPANRCVTEQEVQNTICESTGGRPVLDSQIQSQKQWCCPENAGDIGNGGGTFSPRTEPSR